jgi:hypothetical protein
MRFFIASRCFFGTGWVSPFKGSINASVTLTGYETDIVPRSLGVPTSGKAKGFDGLYHANVVSVVEGRVQNGFLRFQPADRSGQNS